MDKDIKKIIKDNTLYKNTDGKTIIGRLISNINKCYSEINSNENFSNEEDNFGNFTGNNPNIIIINLDNKYGKDE